MARPRKQTGYIRTAIQPFDFFPPVSLANTEFTFSRKLKRKLLPDELLQINTIGESCLNCLSREGERILYKDAESDVRDLADAARTLRQVLNKITSVNYGWKQMEMRLQDVTGLGAKEYKAFLSSLAALRRCTPEALFGPPRVMSCSNCANKCCLRLLKIWQEADPSGVSVPSKTKSKTGETSNQAAIFLSMVCAALGDKNPELEKILPTTTSAAENWIGKHYCF